MTADTSGRGDHRLLCTRLPDGRAALVANVDVDTHPVAAVAARTAAGREAEHAAPLAAAGWVPWPREPGVVGWTDPARTTVVTALGEWRFPGDPAWWELVAARGEVAVVVLLDRPVERWGSAASYADVGRLLDEATAYAGLCTIRRAAPR